LATVYGIVTKLGGDVTVSSEEGVGTTFRVYLPVTTAALQPGTTGNAPAYVRGNGETVLVVDDQPAVRDLTARLLARNGYATLEAGSGRAAIGIALDHDIDLLVADVVMPKMGGPELAEALRIRQPSLPVLFMSGYAPGMHGPLGQPHGVPHGMALIHKPFTEAALLRRVHQTLTAGATGQPEPVAL
jgi:CheY-like chemotaxis protein